MAQRHEVARADEHMRLAEGDPAVHELCGMRDHEQRIAVRLDLRPLVRIARILDREVVQAEFLLELAEQRRLRIEQPDPDEGAVVDRQHVADLVERDIAARPVAAVDDAVDDG